MFGSAKSKLTGVETVVAPTCGELTFREPIFEFSVVIPKYDGGAATPSTCAIASSAFATERFSLRESFALNPANRPLKLSSEIEETPPLVPPGPLKSPAKSGE